MRREEHEKEGFRQEIKENESQYSLIIIFTRSKILCGLKIRYLGGYILH